MKTIKDIEYSFTHVQERLNKRFKGLMITRGEYDSLCEKLRHNKSTLIDVDSNNQEVHLYPYVGKNIFFVFCRKRDYITTVLKSWTPGKWHT